MALTLTPQGFSEPIRSLSEPTYLVADPGPLGLRRGMCGPLRASCCCRVWLGLGVGNVVVPARLELCRERQPFRSQSIQPLLQRLGACLSVSLRQHVVLSPFLLTYASPQMHNFALQ